MAGKNPFPFMKKDAKKDDPAVEAPVARKRGSHSDKKHQHDTGRHKTVRGGKSA
jgi:hypothetical protein